MTCLLEQVPGALRMLPWASAGARAGGRVDAPEVLREFARCRHQKLGVKKSS